MNNKRLSIFRDALELQVEKMKEQSDIDRGNGEMEKCMHMLLIAFTLNSIVLAVEAVLREGGE